MSEQLTLDIPRPSEAVVPCCLWCGAEGERIETTDTIDFGGAALFALAAIMSHESGCPALAEHVREHGNGGDA